MLRATIASTVRNNDRLRQDVYGPIVAAAAAKAAKASASAAAEGEAASSIRQFAIKMLGKDAGRVAFAEAASAAAKFAEGVFWYQVLIDFNAAVNAAQQAKKACMEY